MARRGNAPARPAKRSRTAACYPQTFDAPFNAPFVFAA